MPTPDEEIEENVSLWVHKNMTRLSKQFGASFNGCEKEAFVLFMKEDLNRGEQKKITLAEEAIKKNK